MVSFRRILASFFSIAVVVASTISVSPSVVRADSVDAAVPETRDESRARYVLVARSAEDFASLKDDLSSAGAEILDEYSDVFSGAAVLLSLTQASALLEDQRVSTLEVDDIIYSSEKSLDNSDVIEGHYIIEMVPRASAIAQEELLEVLDENVTYQYTQAFRGFAARLTVAEVKYLRTNPLVKTIEPDRVVRVDGEQVSPPWGLDRLDQQSLPLNQRFSYQGTGAGITAYVVDTGIYSSHSDFGGRVRLGWPSTGAQDCQGHGTHVAGTVAGATYGVAKQASLVSVRVLDCSGSGSNSTVIAGLDWIVSDHSAGVKAIANMSLGGSYSDIVNSAVNRVINDGVVMVVAAGNESIGACTKSPASTPNAITVAASTSSDARAGFSNYGSCVDLFAPGESVLSTLNGGGAGYKSGTSMAAPHVAGAAAVLWELNPTYAASQVMSDVISGATRNKITDTMGSPNRLLYVAPSSGVAPSAPTNVSATTNSGSVTITWSAPTSSGTNAISAYNVVQSNGTSVCAWSSGPLQCQTSSLSAGTYQFKVSASSSAGTSPFSSLSNSITVSVSGNNDFFASARELTTSSGTLNESNNTATRETGEPTVAGATSATRWYKVTPVSNGTLNVNTNGSSFDTVLGVFTGSSVGALTSRASDDDSGDGSASLLSLLVSGGTTYYIQVGSYFASSTGSITLNWSLLGSGCSGNPSNDALACATNLTNLSSSTSGSNVSATLELTELDTTNVCRSVWYRVTPSGNGTANFSTSGSSFDTYMHVYSGASPASSYGSLSLVGSNDDYSGSSYSQLSNVSVSAGQTYFIRISGYFDGVSCSSGSITFSWTVTIVSNISVPSAPTGVVAVGGNGSATVSWSAPSSNGGASISSYTVVSSPGGWTCTTSSLSCAVAGLSNGSSYTFTVSARNVAGSGPSSSPSSSVTIGPTNDNISGAVGVSAGTVYSNNVSATREADEPNHAGVAGGKSMWFRYSSPTLKNVQVSTTGSTFDTVLAVYQSNASSAGTSGVVYGTVFEGSSLTLAAPSGSVFTGVTFASYGTPDGDLGNYSIGSCHASNSSSIISSAFIGQNTGTVLASNTVFGDPCPGTFKRLYVRLSYGPASAVSFSSLQEVGSNDDATDSINGSSFVSFTAQPNVVYFIAVDGYLGWNGSTSGSITLNMVVDTIQTPGTPTRVLAAATNGGAGVSWRKPDTNFSSITGYRVTSSPDGRTCETSALVFSCVVTGLTNGRAYTFTVVSINPLGVSAASIPSNSVTPMSSEISRSIASSWGIDRVDERSAGFDGYLSMAGRGLGARVYVVDTGVRGSHVEFAGRISAGFTSISDGLGTNDCNGHGTHVASSAAGTTYGIATSAVIVPVRVLDCDGSGSDSGVIAGLNWVAQNIRNTNTTAVVNMSLGGSYDSAINSAVRAIVALGVPVVVAAGNDGRDACSASPASEPTAITVAASTNADQEAVYSNYGSCVDIFGPGSSVLAAGISSDSSTSTKSGTSMASPHVAGYATVVKGLFPTASSTAVAAAISGAATSNTLTSVSYNTPNKLLFVGLARCDVAALAGVVCSASVTTPPTSSPLVTSPSSNPLVTPTVILMGRHTAASVAKVVKVKVPSGYRVSLAIKKQANCKLSGGRLVPLKTGVCKVTVQLRKQGKTSKNYVKSVRVQK